MLLGRVMRVKRADNAEKMLCGKRFKPIYPMAFCFFPFPTCLSHGGSQEFSSGESGSLVRSFRASPVQPSVIIFDVCREKIQHSLLSDFWRTGGRGGAYVGIFSDFTLDLTCPESLLRLPHLNQNKVIDLRGDFSWNLGSLSYSISFDVEISCFCNLASS